MWMYVLWCNFNMYFYSLNHEDFPVTCVTIYFQAYVYFQMAMSFMWFLNEKLYEKIAEKFI